ncbi:hypothetical protein N7462_002313 [Penicillium macrosclerotiorum]|uniref:uncharacterized protein n=1 Tax=Penicillium macrosclerotiorum TaxID=303699 RepID=UPI00254739F7|nr:uncharacterized protein N7462_002313 [Penicillium macrosclerotiorum]KAJ5692890.1 hypothetical protein N7462_002313 [Penicillium macrosclerotiorum]
MNGQTATPMSIPGPIALSSWLDANSEKLQPPVNNMCLYSGKDFILMAVGGPNTRNDYHTNTPHSPRRVKDTVGLVMEHVRPPQMIDRIRWYCENKDAHKDSPVIIREESFYCQDIETQLKEVIENWMNNEENRKCGVCGQIAPAH